MARRIGHYLGHQSDRGLPWTYFPNGVTGGTKIAGHEYPGIALVILIMCNTTECITLFRQQMDDTVHRRWICLFELMLGWRTWLKQDSIPKLEMAQSHLANEHLVRQYTATLQRTHGNGCKIAKVHLTTHIAENAMDSGVPSNTDGNPVEQHHVVLGKETGARTSLNADTFEIQTSHRWTEDCIINTISDYLGVNAECVTELKSIDPGPRGARFKISMDQNADTNKCSIASFEWKSKMLVHPYPTQYIEWVARNILIKLTGESVLEGCTEQKIVNDYLFRAHPAYRGVSQWHDWALFCWTDPTGDASNMVYIPGHIIFFLEITKDILEDPNISLIKKCNNLCIDSTGMYALVETLEDPLPLSIKTKKLLPWDLRR